MTQYKYTVIFEPAEEGGYIVHVPALNGIATQGETLEEAKKMGIDLIKGYLETLIELGLPIPDDDFEAEPNELNLEKLVVAL
ncbi:MAG: type II toxin-antitoxin system HicB family antitoxin [candidate division Zixibacteria bacterium]|nr:type II toxin-antitoxin system HicB family antitoxin [Candidatus Tariuqbacter arcticus]